MTSLIEKSDIFVQNFRNGVAKRLDMGYEDLSKMNSSRVYASVPEYGPKRPDAAKPAFAYTWGAGPGSLWYAGPDDENP